MLSLTRDAGAPPTLPVAGSGDHATAVALFSAIAMGLYRRERTGKGSYVTTSLLAAGVWACGVPIQAALSAATFFPLHDRTNPPNATFNVYRASDDTWFLIVLTPDRWPALATGIGRPELLSDARFADPAKQAANAAQLTAILDAVFGAQPMAYWRDVLDHAHITFGVVRAPGDVIKDPQLRQNEMVVPIQVHDVTKVPARRAPEIGEHNEEVLKQLGFDAQEIDSLRGSGAITSPKQVATVS